MGLSEVAGCGFWICIAVLVLHCGLDFWFLRVMHVDVCERDF